MDWRIPGTTLTCPREEADHIEQILHSLFLGGGLTLSQVVTISGLESHTVQNWVKRGFLPSPVGKKYDMERLCRILNMNILRGALPLEQTVQLMAYLNGDLDNESDDLVDDTMLFFLFVKLAARARYIGGTQTWDDALMDATQDYTEPSPGARDKLIKVLKIMLTTWVANHLKSQAEAMISEL